MLDIDTIMGNVFGKAAALDFGIQWGCWAVAALLKTEKFYDLAGKFYNNHFLCSCVISFARAQYAACKLAYTSLIMAKTLCVCARARGCVSVCMCVCGGGGGG